MTDLSTLLSSLRSSPSLEALRQIPQPIWVEWARGEVAIDPGWWSRSEIGKDPGWRESQPPFIIDFFRWEGADLIIARAHRRGNLFFAPIMPLFGAPLSRLIAHVESRASLLAVLRARQQQIEARGTVAAWQAESEEGIF